MYYTILLYSLLCCRSYFPFLSVNSRPASLSCEPVLAELTARSQYVIVMVGIHSYHGEGGGGGDGDGSTLTFTFSDRTGIWEGTVTLI